MVGTTAAEEELIHRSRLAHFHLADVEFSDLISLVRCTHEMGLEDAKFHCKKNYALRHKRQLRYSGSTGPFKVCLEAGLF